MNLAKTVFSLLTIGLPSLAIAEDQPSHFEANFESLANHPASPQWFQDAKLGIYFHWGVYSVPAYNTEWYPRLMHVPGHAVYDYHREHYGPPSEFGYHDFVEDFTAQHFDASEWVALFKEAGAKFVGPVAEHHDGFSMWDSDITPWNAAAKGPKRDITGEIAEAARAQGLKVITTFHHARNLQRYRDDAEAQWAMMEKNQWHGFEASHYPIHPSYPNATIGTELDYLYGNVPEAKWLEEIWLGKVEEVVDKYHPDIIWFDSWLDSIPEAYRARMCAYYLNEAAKRNQEVVIVRKQDDLPLSFTVDDLEKSRKNELDSRPWMTDETLSTGSWCYTKDMSLKPTEDVLHILIDIVSKNGVLLLNVSPKSDGTIPADQQDSLRRMGAWLSEFGEAIYGTKPWYTYGEGPTVQPEGRFENAAEFAKIKYSYRDVRYTTKDNLIYATALGCPESGSLLLEAFASDQLSERPSIISVALLNSGTNLEWSLDKNGLLISSNNWGQADQMATVIKIALADTDSP